MIKKQKNKLLTLLVAGMIATAGFGGATLANATADTTETASYTPAISTIFSTTSATLDKDGAVDVSGDLKMQIKNGGKVDYRRDLALKWYEGANDAKYMSMSFKLANTNFSKLTFTVETESLTATKDGKAINQIVFTKTNDDVFVKVNEGTEYPVAIENGASKKLTVSLGAGQAENQFDVLLTEEGSAQKSIGTFENISVNFAEYDSGETSSLKVEATNTEGTADVLFYELNGQSLEVNKDKKFTDNKAPVLVVNEDIDGFVLGTAFALDFEVIDVLDGSISKTALEYYQFNPADAEAKEGVVADPVYKKLTTSTTYFHETNYEKTTDEMTSVYKETGGTEYVSIRFNLVDDGDNKFTYYLGWYLDKAKVELDQQYATLDSKYTDVDYVQVYSNENEISPYYTFNKRNDTEKTDELDETNVAYQAFVTALEDLQGTDGKGLTAGEGSYLYLPSMKNMISDNGGYSNLRFTISYKTTSNNTARTSSNLASSSLKLELTQAGVYEFKIFAVDKAGNAMKYYNEEGELVDVTSSNVWDFDAIPTFSVNVINAGLKVEDESKKVETEVIYGKYDLPDFDIIGSSDANETYSIFYLDETVVGGITSNQLTSVSYDALVEKAAELKKNGATETGIELYKLAYATKVAEANGNVTATKILEALKEIQKYNDKINKEDHPDEWNVEYGNSYEWKESSKTFIPQKMGNYLVLACFTDPDIAAFDVGAYMIVEVEAEEDVIYGETDWLKNNIASVILFSIAGVMLILIIILLVVKPSDETLEEVTANGEGKQEKKAKSVKKSKENELEELDSQEK